jgi:hypothetical protein
MKHQSTLLRGFVVLCALVLVLAGMNTDLLAQRIINITPGFGTLNNVIRGDTTALGARIDTNTVYRLQRGGLYILNGTMDHNYPVIIEAAPGAGAKPKIIQGVPSGGVAPTEAWAARATLRMKHIYISAMDELGGNHERIFRIRANGITVVMDSCHLDFASQAGFRFDNANARVFFYNSIISNIGTGDSPANGRGFDDRGVDIDTLVLENSTFYNLTSRVIRDAGGITKYCKVNHCTMFNIGEWGVSFGPCNSAVFTNNVLMNAAYYGANSKATSAAGEKQIVVTLLPLPGGAAQTADIRNNNLLLDSLITKVWPDTVKAEVFFDSTWQAFMTSLGTAGTVYSEKIDFQNAPDSPVNVVQDWYTNPTPPNPNLDTVGSPFNFIYPTSQLAYTRGSDGKPLGDLNWFGIPLTSVQELSDRVPAAFRLYDAYPNPFNPETNIRFDLLQAGFVSVEVFNALGQKVATLVDEMLPAGSHQVRWTGQRDDGARMSSGVYLYRLSTNGFVDVRRMMLVK